MGVAPGAGAGALGAKGQGRGPCWDLLLVLQLQRSGQMLQTPAGRCLLVFITFVLYTNVCGLLETLKFWFYSRLKTTRGDKTGN